MNALLAVLAAVLTPVAIFLAAQHQTFTRVNADGPELRMLVAGRGKPTVVFEAGAGASLDHWIRIQPRVSQFAQTVSYDRAGNGLSEAGPVPRDGSHVVAELHAALENARLSPPYILVGHSLGGPFIRLFAATYPNEVAGLVLVDPTQEDLLAWAKEQDHDQDREKSKHVPRPEDEVDCAPQTFAELKEKPLPPNLAVTLISGVGPLTVPSFMAETMRREVEKDRFTLYPAKLRFHRAWVAKYPGAKLVVTQLSGHGIPYEEPDLVVTAIRDLVAKVTTQ